MATITLPDQDQRDLIAGKLDCNMLVEAAAGTGKTSSMIGRMLALLRTGTCKHARSLAAVTFTRKAAAELRGRFQIKLEEAVKKESGQAQRYLKGALSTIEQCFIGTIHSFCGRLLRERPVEAGVDPTFEEIDEGADLQLRRMAWAEYSARLIAADDSGIIAELDDLGLSLADLGPAFLRFTNYPDVGEWPVTSNRTGAPASDAYAAEVLQYIEHMKSLAHRLPDDSGTDELIPTYRRMPRIVAHYGGLPRPRDVMTVLERFSRKTVFRVTVWQKNRAFTKDEARAEDARWEEFRTDVAERGLTAWREYRYGPVLRVLKDASELYDTMRRRRGQLSYQDLLMKAAALLREHPHVRKYFRERFTHLLVDEFQDTDPIQAEVMLLLTTMEEAGSDWRAALPEPGTLFVVGDPKQSIYRFRRADILTYNEVKEIIKKSGQGSTTGLVVQLSANFRTTGTIIDWVNRVFEPRPDEPHEPLGPVLRFPATDRPESPFYVPLAKGRIEVSPGTLSGVYRLTIPEECGKKEEVQAYEAQRIARIIGHALDNPAVTIPRTQEEIDRGKTGRLEASDFLIISRNRAGLNVYGQALQELGIPSQITGGSTLNEVAELTLLHTYLTALVNPDDPVALVAALRGELFGVSDVALYEYKRGAGRFSFSSEVPGDLPEPCRGTFQDAFTTMRNHHILLSALPAAAAFDRIVADLGLLALAASRPGGDVQAGSLGKAIEILRINQHEAWTTAQLVEQLGGIIAATEPYDGISARSQQHRAVRLMNLHKVKGLEAPVVFLANPYGEGEHDPEIHIDRSSGKVTGYLAVRGKATGRSYSILAHPARWNGFQDTEQRFLAAEALRLRYVAATRAGAALVITRRNRGRGLSPWLYFQPHLLKKEEIREPAGELLQAARHATMEIGDVRAAELAISERRSRVTAPTYEARGAKELALAQPAAVPQPGDITSTPEPAPEEIGLPDEGEHGVAWGTVIHTLLEVAMVNPDADLEGVARTALVENDLDPEHAREAVLTVKTVMQSELWRRARASKEVLIEPPFQVLADDRNVPDAPLPILLRGRMDLVFQEDDGWVLVDYKTDRIGLDTLPAVVAKYTPQMRLYANAWQRCTGCAPKETGLYFVRGDRYVVVRVS